MICERCQLAKTRRRPVPGRGAIPCTLMLVGESPTQGDEALGKPFTGRVRLFLARVLERIGKPNTRIFATYVCACRATESRVGLNRSPTPDEAYACAARLEGEILKAKPRRVAALGAVAHKLIKPLVPDAIKLPSFGELMQLEGAGCAAYMLFIRKMEGLIDEAEAEAESDREDAENPPG